MSGSSFILGYRLLLCLLYYIGDVYCDCIRCVARS